MKILLILLDGVADRSYQVLGWRTPLEAAPTPNLDRMAALGGTGLYHATRPGECLPSEQAHFSLFGYKASEFPGRGLLEAVGAGVPFEDQDVLALAHLSPVRWEGGAALLAASRKDLDLPEDEMAALFGAVSSYEAGGVGFRLHRIGKNDAILVMHGEVSPHISDSDPMVRGLPMACVVPVAGCAEAERAQRTASALNAYLAHCAGVLESHEVNQRRVLQGLLPANFLATQRCGRRIPLADFAEQWGMKAMMIASGAVYEGLAGELGMTLVRGEDTGDPGADLSGRVARALEDDAHSFFHVHTKAPDEAAHRSGPEEKARVIGRLDEGLGELRELLEGGDDLVVAVTGDHATPCGSRLIHSGEASPLLIAGAHVRRDRVGVFNEVDAAAGCLGLLRGPELMGMLVQCAEGAPLKGQLLGAKERAYLPVDYEPFGRGH